MKSTYHITAGFLTILMLTTGHIHAISPHWSQKMPCTVIQKIKHSAHCIKRNLAKLQVKRGKGNSTEKQLLLRALIGVTLVASSLFLPAIPLPYTWERLKRALQKGDQTIIMDYLDKGRIDPNDTFEGESVLSWAVKRWPVNHKKAIVEKLLAMGADPRNGNSAGKTVIECMEEIIQQIKSRIKLRRKKGKPLIALRWEQRLSQYVEHFKNTLLPLLMRKTHQLKWQEARTTIFKETALCAQRNNAPKLPPELWTHIAWFL